MNSNLVGCSTGRLGHVTKAFDRLLPLRRPNGRSGVGGRRQARGGRLRLASWLKQFAPVGPRPHLVARCSGDEIAIFPYLPSSAKGAVDGNCPQGHVARRDGQIALRLEQILFCRQNGCEVRRPALVLLQLALSTAGP
jgi:hypothetical protein